MKRLLMIKNKRPTLSSPSKFGEEAYRKIFHKYRVSISFYIFLNVFSFSLTAGLVLLNLFAIKWNSDPHYLESKILFVTLAILSGFGGFVTTVMTFFNFKSKVNKIDILLLTLNEDLENLEKSETKKEEDLAMTKILKTLSNK